jgi:Pyrimidine dimer DNA glycosylase
MRLWSLHPRYLDAQGLVALWREALLARAVLRGKTRGYKHHPQLERFREHPLPVSAVNYFLSQVHAEATIRGYSFDASKVGPYKGPTSIPVTTGQLQYEWAHLLRKLKERNPEVYRLWRKEEEPESHPLFRKVKGSVASWEKLQ